MADALDGVALVTGGGRGIGATIARELAEGGMKVAGTFSAERFFVLSQRARSPARP